MKSTIKVLNDLEARKVFLRYALGGAMAALFYIEPVATEDLDVFVLLPADTPVLTPLSAIYGELRRLGYQEDGLYVIIEGIPVQFLPAYKPLIDEAVAQARQFPLDEEVQVRVPSPEYLMAVMLQTGRSKDRIRFDLFRREVEFDVGLLEDILKRHDLEAKYKEWLI